MKIIPTEIVYDNHYGNDLRIKAIVPCAERERFFGLGVGKELHLSEYDFPEKAIIKCAHCPQWAAKYAACKHCGAPVG